MRLTMAYQRDVIVALVLAALCAPQVYVSGEEHLVQALSETEYEPINTARLKKVDATSVGIEEVLQIAQQHLREAEHKLGENQGASFSQVVAEEHHDAEEFSRRLGEIGNSSYTRTEKQMLAKGGDPSTPNRRISNEIVNEYQTETTKTVKAKTVAIAEAQHEDQKKKDALIKKAEDAARKKRREKQSREHEAMLQKIRAAAEKAKKRITSVLKYANNLKLSPKDKAKATEEGKADGTARAKADAAEIIKNAEKPNALEDVEALIEFEAQVVHAKPLTAKIHSKNRRQLLQESALAKAEDAATAAIKSGNDIAINITAAKAPSNSANDLTKTIDILVRSMPGPAKAQAKLRRAEAASKAKKEITMTAARKIAADKASAANAIKDATQKLAAASAIVKRGNANVATIATKVQTDRQQVHNIGKTLILDGKKVEEDSLEVQQAEGTVSNAQNKAEAANKELDKVKQDVTKNKQSLSTEVGEALNADSAYLLAEAKANDSNQALEPAEQELAASEKNIKTQREEVEDLEKSKVNADEKVKEAKEMKEQNLKEEKKARKQLVEARKKMKEESKPKSSTMKEVDAANTPVETAKQNGAATVVKDVEQDQQEAGKKKQSPSKDFGEASHAGSTYLLAEGKAQDEKNALETAKAKVSASEKKLESQKADVGELKKAKAQADDNRKSAKEEKKRKQENLQEARKQQAEIGKRMKLATERSSLDIKELETGKRSLETAKQNLQSDSDVVNNKKVQLAVVKSSEKAENKKSEKAKKLLASSKQDKTTASEFVKTLSDEATEKQGSAMIQQQENMNAEAESNEQLRRRQSNLAKEIKAHRKKGMAYVGELHTARSSVVDLGVSAPVRV